MKMACSFNFRPLPSPMSTFPPQRSKQEALHEAFRTAFYRVVCEMIEDSWKYNATAKTHKKACSTLVCIVSY